MTEITDYQASFKDEDGNLNAVEIDLYGRDDKKTVLVGECKFKKDKFNKSELEAFREKVRLTHTEKVFLCLFSLSGFTEYVKENAEGIHLISLDDIYKNDLKK